MNSKSGRGLIGRVAGQPFAPQNSKSLPKRAHIDLGRDSSLPFELRPHIAARHQIDFSTTASHLDGILSRTRFSRCHFLAFSLPGLVENDWAIGENAAS